MAQISLKTRDKEIIIITPYDDLGTIDNFFNDFIRPLLRAVEYTDNTIDDYFGEE